MSIEDMYTLVRLLKQFLESDGDLPDKRVTKSLEFIHETLADSDPDYHHVKEF